ncbi:MAG: ImmA/IrrE family metallo-endopeptidase [Clostridia bacterium]|nr:ImmA/IrrE family metallo-endopeptidase [Clostridia bacterium]
MSSTYRQYQEARDTAWRALLKLTDKRLPVEPEALAALLGVEILPFPGPKEDERLWTLANQVRGVCVSLRIQGAWHMFIRDGIWDASQRRFAVAHELGHLLLGHDTRPLAPGVRCFSSGDNQGDLIEEPQEMTDYAADIFAIRLLAPACILHELGVDTVDGITALCGLPPRAAALRAERMKLLNRRNAFYANPLERQVRDAFRPFLLSRMAPAAPKRTVPLVLPERKLPEPRAPRCRFSLGFWQRRAIYALLLLAALALLFLLGKRV